MIVLFMSTFVQAQPWTNIELKKKPVEKKRKKKLFQCFFSFQSSQLKILVEGRQASNSRWIIRFASTSFRASGRNDI